MKNAKTEALHKKLGNVIFCKSCGKKHAQGKHDKGATKEEHHKGSEEKAEKEVEKEEDEE